MTDWNGRYIRLAHHIADWSRDPSTKVGAVIVDTQQRIVSTGFNGFARGVDDDVELYAQRDVKLLRTLHAEQNAILFAHRSIAGCTLYVTHPPCARCAAMLIQSGIKRVVHPPNQLSDKWAQELAAAQAMYREAGVVVEVMNG